MLSELFDEQAQREQYEIALKNEIMAEGMAKEKEQNIKSLVCTLKPVLKSIEAVIDAVAKTFGLPEAEAAKKINTYWSMF